MIKLIRYYLLPIVKHVLAPQNDFGMPKITWSNHISFGIEETPPPYVGKNSQIIPNFFYEGIPKGSLKKTGELGNLDQQGRGHLWPTPKILYYSNWPNTENIFRQKLGLSHDKGDGARRGVWQRHKKKTFRIADFYAQFFFRTKRKNSLLATCQKNA